MRPARRRQRGNSMIEFALASTILLPLMTGAFQFGYGLYVYNRLENAVRCGARYAARLTYDSSTATPSAAFTTAIQNMVAYGNPSGGTSTVVPGLNPQDVSISMALYSGAPDIVTVSIQQFQIDAGIGKITVYQKPSSSFRYQGRFAP